MGETFSTAPPREAPPARRQSRLRRVPSLTDTPCGPSYRVAISSALVVERTAYFVAAGFDNSILNGASPWSWITVAPFTEPKCDILPGMCRKEPGL